MTDVTDADRGLYKALFKVNPDDDGFDDVLNRGGFDDFWQMQEIARHREASIAPYVEALEWISDQIAFACQGDCENGVRWLNEKASANYLKDAPAMKEAIAAIQTKIDALLENSHVD